jgi:hypothetical protein
MTTFTEGTHAGEFLISEGNNTRSREKVTILSGQNLAAGAVLAVNGDAKYLEVDPDASDDTEIAVAILYDAVDATDGDVEGVAIVRDAEVRGTSLAWPVDSNIEALGIVALAAQGIIVR